MSNSGGFILQEEIGKGKGGGGDEGVEVCSSIYSLGWTMAHSLPSQGNRV